LSLCIKCIELLALYTLNCPTCFMCGFSKLHCKRAMVTAIESCTSPLAASGWECPRKEATETQLQDQMISWPLVQKSLRVLQRLVSTFNWEGWLAREWGLTRMSWEQPPPTVATSERNDRITYIPSQRRQVVLLYSSPVTLVVSISEFHTVRAWTEANTSS
jgi:hypothetical protein